MYFNRWKLVLGVLDDYCGQSREVLGDLGRARLHDQYVLVVQFSQELRVAFNALQQGLWLQFRDVLLLIYLGFWLFGSVLTNFCFAG